MITPHKILIEEYRPHKLDDIIGQDLIIKRLKIYVETRNLPHLIFSGAAGTGKTSASVALAKELYGNNYTSNFLEINASVSKTTPILIRINENRIERVDFQYLDKYYSENIEDIEVLTLGDDLKVKWSKVTKLIKHKVEKLLRISFEGGTLELTGNHSVIVFNKEGELVTKSASELGTEDYLISFCNNLEDDNVIEETKSLVTLDIDNTWLYGIYRSEGCLAKNHIVLTLGSHEREYIDKIRNISEYKFGINTSETLVESGYGKQKGKCGILSGNQVKLFSDNLVPFFMNMFYEKHNSVHNAHTKRVPFFMFGQTLQNKLSYIKGDYDGDGSDIYNNNFRITSVSRNSLIDLGWLGRTSELHTSVYPENNVVHLLKKSFKSDLIPADLVINILSKISNNILKYNWRYDLRHILYERKDGYESRRITKEALFNIMKSVEIPKFQNTLFYYLDGGSDIYETIKNKFVDKLRIILSSDVHSVSIKKIEIIEYNDFVYDVSVPENQMFFAGDIPLLLHNSDERGIGVVRDRIKKYASVSSIGDIDFKIIFLDEADALTNDAQSALRRIIERYTNSCRFILSCNYSSKVIEPIQSRMAVYRFKKIQSKDIIKQCKYIADQEKIKIDSESLEAIAYLAEGDCRRAVQLLDNARLVLTPEHNIVTIKDIYETTSFIEPKIMIDILKNALSGKFNSSSILMENLLLDGLSAEDITPQLIKRAMELNLPHEKFNVELVDIIGETHWRISQGEKESIALKWMIAKMAKLGSLI